MEIKKKSLFKIIKKKFTFGPTFGPTIKPTSTIDPNLKVKDIPAFHNATYITIQTKEDLKNIVELPCLRACEELFEKNIETVESGCNGENCYDAAYIKINYDTMDKANQLIADRLVQQGKVKFNPRVPGNSRSPVNIIFIKIPTTPDEPVSSVSERLCNIIKDFVPQKRIIKEIWERVRQEKMLELQQNGNY